MQRVLLVLSLLITSVAQAQSIQVKNPLMWTDAPDPDIIRVGSKFYMVSTSMHYVPGSPVLQSSDLVNFSKSDEGIGGTADFNWFRFNNH